MKRRKFIKLSATASVLSLNSIEIRAALNPLLSLAGCPDISNRKIVLINLAGGNDGLNTLIPINQYARYSVLRPTIKVPRAGSKAYINLDVSLPDNQQIGLNPSLTEFKALYDQGWLRILQSVGYPSQNKSHFKSTDLYLTGNDGNSMQNGFDSGWIGRFMELFYSNIIGGTFPMAVEIGSNKTSLGFHGKNEHGLALNITGQDPAGFYSVLSGLGGEAPAIIPDTDYGKELEFITNTDVLSNQYAQSISSSFNTGNNAVSYPDSDISNQLKTVARLISGGLETKVYLVRISGFDTHNAQVQGNGDPLGRHYELLSELSQAIGAFFNDLKQQNLSEDVVGLTFSEFGRKAAENGNLGTDHGEIAPMFVFGEPVEGGVSGTNPDLDEAKDTNNYQIKTVQHDYRQTFGTLLQDFLGADNSIIDATFFNHTLNESFTNLKITDLVKDNYVVSEACIAGIDEPDVNLEEYTWQVYPNPCRDNLHVSSLEDIIGIEYKLFTMAGILIAHRIETVSQGKTSIYLGHLSQGVYMLQINSNSKTETHKIIKI
jgi:uncharacterized protein (DUF1501 family)